MQSNARRLAALGLAASMGIISAGVWPSIRLVRAAWPEDAGSTVWTTADSTAGDASSELTQSDAHSSWYATWGQDQPTGAPADQSVWKRFPRGQAVGGTGEDTVGIAWKGYTRSEPAALGSEVSGIIASGDDSLETHFTPSEGPAAGAYQSAMDSGWETAEPVFASSAAGEGLWFGGVYGLGMTRDHEDSVWLSYNTGDPTMHLLGNRDADMDWQGGTEIRIGRILFGSPYALEAVLWGIYSGTEEANVFDSGVVGLGTVFDFADLVADGQGGGLGAAAFVNDFFDGATRHRLRRSYEFQNVELNLLRLPVYSASPDGAGGLFARGLLGFRYLRADEAFQYASDFADSQFGTSGDEIFYDIDVENHLIGVQVGGRVDYLFSSRLSLYADVKFGIFGNHISHNSRIGNQNGPAVVGLTAFADVGRPFDIHSTKTDVSMLGELRAGVDYQLSPHWRLTGGYRAVGMTGVALATNQIPVYMVDLDGVAAIDTNGSMILHGFQLGLECNY
jgi:hypothetical protein